MQLKKMDYAPPTSCFEILTSSTQQQQQLSIVSNLSTSTVDSIRLNLSNNVNDLQTTSLCDATNSQLYVAPIFTAASINETAVASAAAAVAAETLNSLATPKESQNAVTLITSQQSINSSPCYSSTPFLFQDSSNTQYLSNYLSTSIPLVSHSNMPIDSSISDFPRSFFSTSIQQPNQLFPGYSISSSMNSHFQTFDYGYQSNCQFSTDQNSATAAAAAAAAEFMVGSNVGIYDLAATAALVSCANAPSNVSQSFLNNVSIAPSSDYYYDHLSAPYLYHNQIENLNNAPLIHDANFYTAPISFHSNHLYPYSYPINQTLAQQSLQQQQNLQQSCLKPKNNHLTNLATAQQLFINSALAAPYSFPHIAAASVMSSALNNNNSIITSIPSSSITQSCHSLNTNEIYQNLTSNILQPLGVSSVCDYFF